MGELIRSDSVGNDIFKDFKPRARIVITQKVLKIVL